MRKTPFIDLLFSLPILVLAVILLRHGLAIDRAISNLFFIDKKWIWPKSDATLTFWLHEIPKYIFIFIGVSCLIASIAGGYSKILARWRLQALMVALSLAITPIVIGQLKKETYVFCPSELEFYQGSVSNHYRQMKLTQDEWRQARCFPASHPSPGFSLLVLGVLASTRRRKIFGYGFGVVIGSILSVIQIGRGEHFLTHCLATALIALWIAHALPFLVEFVKKMADIYRHVQNADLYDRPIKLKGRYAFAFGRRR